MNRSLFFMLLVCCCCKGFAQIKEFSADEIEKTFSKVNDTLYASRYETSNGEYNNFLNAVIRKDPNLYALCKVDSARWLEGPYYSEPMSEYYHRHPAFKNYPVLCVAYESAIAYCNWLTSLYNNDSKRKFRKVIFILPSEQEWELAAMGTNKNIVYPWGTNSLRDRRKGSWRGQFLANYSHLGDAAIVSDSSGNPVFDFEKEREEVFQSSGLDDRAFYTADVRSFYPNSIGIYNLSGNAAEMTIEKGLTKGGSYKSFGGEITITYKLYFKKSSPEVGFRVFMKIIEQ